MSDSFEQNFPQAPMLGTPPEFADSPPAPIEKNQSLPDLVPIMAVGAPSPDVISDEIKLYTRDIGNEEEINNTDPDSAEGFFLEERIASRKMGQIEALASHYGDVIRPEDPSKLKTALNYELSLLQNDPEKYAQQIAETQQLLETLSELQMNPEDVRTEDEQIASVLGKSYAASTQIEKSMNSIDSAPESIPSDQSETDESNEKSKRALDVKEVASFAFHYFLAHPDNNMTEFMEFFFGQREKGLGTGFSRESGPDESASWEAALGAGSKTLPKDNFVKSLLNFFESTGKIPKSDKKGDSKDLFPSLTLLRGDEKAQKILFDELLSDPMDPALQEVIESWLKEDSKSQFAVGQPDEAFSFSDKRFDQLLKPNNLILLAKNLTG